jgi:hypothetical protein
MGVDDPTIGRRGTYVDEVTLDVLVLLRCLDWASPFDPVSVFLMSEVIHLVASLTYWDTIICDA